MPAITETIQTDTTRLRVVWLPSDSQARTSYTITVDGAISSGTHTSITVDASPTALYQGSKIVFSGVTLTVSADTASGATSIPVESATFSLADDEEGSTFGMIEVYGANSSSVDTSNDSVPIDGYGDGVEMKSLNVSVSRTVNISGILTDGAFRDFLYQARETSYVQREVFFELEYSDGRVMSGPARVESPSENLDKSGGVINFSMTLISQDNWPTTAAA